MLNGVVSRDNRHKPLRRASVTTISSLENQENLASLSPFDDESPSTSVTPFNDSINHSSQSNVKIDGSKAIHVGDIINKYYVTQTLQTINPDPKFPLPSAESFEGLSETWRKVENNDRFTNKAWRFIKKRKYWFLIGLVLLVSGLSIGITLAVLDDSGNNETTNVSTESTTSVSEETTTSENVQSSISSTTFSISTTISTTISEITSSDSSSDASSTASTESSTTTENEIPTTTSEVASSTTADDFLLIMRDDWSAGTLDSSIPKLSQPIKRIIVAHTAGASCNDLSNCVVRVQQIQAQNASLLDIPYNILIGGNGLVFEGRGMLHEGEHTANLHGSNFNNIGISVAFIGTFYNTTPTEAQLDAFKSFLNHFSASGNISRDHKLFFQDQLSNPKAATTALKSVLETFSKFHSSLLSKLF